MKIAENIIWTEELEKLELLLEQGQFELLFPGERCGGGEKEVWLVYLMNDAVESFLVFYDVELTGTDRMGARECYREVILDNIEYSYLVQDSHIDREQLDEIVDLIVDTVCSARKVIRIAGDDYPAEVVKSRFMKLDSSHVQYVMDCMKDNTTYVRNIKKYLLAALYNAPTTINSYYSSLVQHDMYGDGQRGRG